MNDEKFANEYLRRYYCRFCMKGKQPEKCEKKSMEEKHDGYWCHAYRCDIDKSAREAMA